MMRFIKLLKNTFQILPVFLIGSMGIFMLEATSIQTKSPDIEMVFVKGGSFLMGCTKEQQGCDDTERPAHKVILDDFYISKYEVTQAQYKAVMGEKPSFFKGCKNCPVDGVTWKKAKRFCRKLSKMTGKKYKLPTEAQWEYAARGGQKSKGFLYPGSNKVEDVAWLRTNSGFKTHPVGEKLPNELGIYDMAGNVDEWCSDWYGDNYYSKCKKKGIVKNPKGVRRSKIKVLRGGNWFDAHNNCTLFNRSGNGPQTHFAYIGFRIVLIP